MTAMRYDLLERKHVTAEQASKLTASKVRAAQERNSRDQSRVINDIIHTFNGYTPLSELRKQYAGHPIIEADILLSAEASALNDRERELRNFGKWYR